MAHSRNMRDFARRMGVIADAVDKGSTKLLRGAALQLLTGLVLGTPVDTGRARGNWLTGLNSPVGHEDEGTDQSGGPTIAEGSTIISQVKQDDDIWVSNNLPYIMKLADGSSEQAPSGWIENVIDAVEDWIDEEGDNFLAAT